MRNFRLALIIFLMPLVAGCWTSVVASGAMGVNYTLTNVAYKTLNASPSNTSSAVEKAFKRMGITLISNSPTQEGRTIKGATKGLDIVVELEEITSKTTKISVDAKKNAILKDRATATQIIEQTEKSL